MVKKTAWNIKNGANVASSLDKTIFSSQKWNTARGLGRGSASEGVRFALSALKWCRVNDVWLAIPALELTRLLCFISLFQRKEKKWQQMLQKKKKNVLLPQSSTKSRSCNSFMGYYLFFCPGTVVFVAFWLMIKCGINCSFFIQAHPRDVRLLLGL